MKVVPNNYVVTKKSIDFENSINSLLGTFQSKRSYGSKQALVSLREVLMVMSIAPHFTLKENQSELLIDMIRETSDQEIDRKIFRVLLHILTENITRMTIMEVENCLVATHRLIDVILLELMKTSNLKQYLYYRALGDILNFLMPMSNKYKDTVEIINASFHNIRFGHEGKTSKMPVGFLSYPRDAQVRILNIWAIESSLVRCGTSLSSSSLDNILIAMFSGNRSLSRHGAALLRNFVKNQSERHEEVCKELIEKLKDNSIDDPLTYVYFTQSLRLIFHEINIQKVEIRHMLAQLLVPLCPALSSHRYDLSSNFYPPISKYKRSN